MQARQASAAIERRSGLRSSAALLALAIVLALSVGAAGHGATTHKHAVRGAAVLAVATVNSPHLTARGDTPTTMPQRASVAGLRRAPGGATHAVVSVSSPTGRTPLVRGPPVQAAV